MKTLVCLALGVRVLASAAPSFAQSTPDPVTRAQVRADLVRVEQAGYNPTASDDATYPADILAAEARIAAQDGQQMAIESVGGTVLSSTVQTGALPHVQRINSTYTKH